VDGVSAGIRAAKGFKGCIRWEIGRRPPVGNLESTAKLPARGDASRTGWNPDVETTMEGATDINEGEIVHYL